MRFKADEIEKGLARSRCETCVTVLIRCLPQQAGAVGFRGPQDGLSEMPGMPINPSTASTADGSAGAACAAQAVSNDCADLPV
jgi:hypothetical protein